jgi:GT2 family glycosyltransferase
MHVAMRIGIVVATHKRPIIVREFLDSVQLQSRLPDDVVLSAVERSDAPDLERLRFPVKLIFGNAGSCAQRNRGIEYLTGRVEVILFLDDDFWMAKNYIAELAGMFANNERIAGITGHVIADGAVSSGFSVSEAEMLLAQYDTRHIKEAIFIRDVPDAYGCNMAFRVSSIGEIRFDEHLPLYGWQEDVDFSAQVRKISGRIVRTNIIWGIHLGTKMGKTSGIRFGYSQIINPLYVFRKGNMSLSSAALIMFKNVAANLAKSAIPEPYIDRRGRLRGNLTGIYHLLQGRLDPTYILRL